TQGQDFAAYGVTTEAVSELTKLGYGSNNPFVFNYQTTITSFGLQALYTFSNIKFHSTAPKLGIYGIAGISGFSAKVMYDAKDANGNTYDYVTLIGQDIVNYNNGTTTRKDFLQIAGDKLATAQDGDFETVAATQNIGVDPVKVNIGIQMGVGLAYRLSDRVSIAVEPIIIANANDYLDGRAYESPGIRSNGGDVPFYIPVRVNFNLGDTKKKIYSIMVG
ncbi:MAG: hypothetical protein HC803_06815, partial [Saprospiraceae bacterium]|nr:hypothetical protein [Saprospiraceae bacterium]